MRRTAAHPVDSMGRVISITESFWAWARGRTGDTAPVGAVIASTAPAEEGITEEGTTACAETADMATQPITDMSPQHTLTTATPMPQLRMVTLLTERPMRKQSTVANTTRTRS